MTMSVDIYCDESQWHDAANIFPLMSEEELQVLANDIKKNGQRNPIVLLNGKVLDVRNRALACQLAGVRPDTQPRNAEKLGSPTAWVLSQNLHRRQLTASQRAMIATEAEKLFALEIAEKERLRKIQSTEAKLPQSSERAPQARDQAATALNVSSRYVQNAKGVAAKSPEIADKVKSGELSLSEAMKATAGMPGPPKKTKVNRDAYYEQRLKKLVAEIKAPVPPNKAHLKSLAIVLDLLKTASVELAKVKNVESIEEYEALIQTHKTISKLTNIEDGVTKRTKNLNRHLAEELVENFDGTFDWWATMYSDDFPSSGTDTQETLRHFKRFAAQKGYICTGGYSFIQVKSSSKAQKKKKSAVK